MIPNRGNIQIVIDIAHKKAYSDLRKFNGQSRGNTVTQSYRACKMAASCKNFKIDTVITENVSEDRASIVFCCVIRKDDFFVGKTPHRPV